MSRTRIVKGKITEITGGTYRVFSDNIEINSDGRIDYYAPEYTYGEPEKYVPRQPEGSVNIFVGMFFDGTGNNRFNSDSVYYSKIKSSADKLKAEDIPVNQETEIIVEDENKKQKKVKVKITDRDSYWNPYSNVAKMYELYREVTDKDYQDEQNHPEYGKHLILKQYIEGIGTSKGEPDDILGSGLARSSWGILSRVREGIEKVVKEQFIAAKGKKINKIIFDVFGFSRGAAAARHFCNEVSKKESYRNEIKNDPYDKYPLPTGRRIIDAHAGGILGAMLNERGYESVHDTYEIEIRFLGVYDTVISDMVLKDNLGMKLVVVNRWFPVAELALTPINTDVSHLKIGQIMHITAQDEWRDNFALTPTNAGYTLSMHGAHSDIGGGYAELQKYEPILDFFDADAKKINEGTEFWEEKKKLRNFYVNNLYCHDYFSNVGTVKFINTHDHYLNINATPSTSKYFPSTGIEFVNRSADYEPSKEFLYDSEKKHALYETKLADHIVLQDSRYISNKYSLVPLNLMLEYAIKYDVPFYKDYNKAKPPVKYLFEYEIPEEQEFDKLREYLQVMRKIVFDDKSSNYIIPQQLFHHIMNKYIHLSAHYGGLENDYIKIKGGDHSLLGDMGFVNHPVKYDIDKNGKVQFKRERYEP